MLKEDTKKQRKTNHMRASPCPWAFKKVTMSSLSRLHRCKPPAISAIRRCLSPVDITIAATYITMARVTGMLIEQVLGSSNPHKPHSQTQCREALLAKLCSQKPPHLSSQQFIACCPCICLSPSAELAPGLIQAALLLSICTAGQSAFSSAKQGGSNQGLKSQVRNPCYNHLPGAAYCQFHCGTLNIKAEVTGSTNLLLESGHVDSKCGNCR